MASSIHSVALGALGSKSGTTTTTPTTSSTTTSKLKIKAFTDIDAFDATIVDAGNASDGAAASAAGGNSSFQRSIFFPTLHVTPPPSTYVDPFLSVWQSLWYTVEINDLVRVALDKMEKAVAYNTVFFLKMVLDLQAAYIPSLKPPPPPHAMLDITHIVRIAELFAGRLARKEKEPNSLSRELQLRTLIAAVSLLCQYDGFKADNDTYAKLIKHISERDWDNRGKYAHQEKVGGLGSGNYEFLIRYACDLVRSLPNEFPTFQMQSLNPISINWLFAAGFVNQLEGLPTASEMDNIFARISAPPSKWHRSMRELTQRVSTAIALRYQSQAQLTSSATMYYAEYLAAELTSNIIGQIRQELNSGRPDSDYVFFEMIKNGTISSPKLDYFPGLESQMVLFGLLDLLVQLAAAFPFSDNVVYDAKELARQIIAICEQEEIRFKAFELVISSATGCSEEEYFDVMRDLESYIDNLASTETQLTDTEKMSVAMRIEGLKTEKRMAMDRYTEKMIFHRGAIESLIRRLMGKQSQIGHSRYPSAPPLSVSPSWAKLSHPPPSVTASVGSKPQTLSGHVSPVATPAISKNEHCIAYVKQTPYVPETPNEPTISCDDLTQMNLPPLGRPLDAETTSTPSYEKPIHDQKLSPIADGDHSLKSRPLSFQSGAEILQVPANRRRKKELTPLPQKMEKQGPEENVNVAARKDGLDEIRGESTHSLNQSKDKDVNIMQGECSDSEESGEIEIFLQIPSSQVFEIQNIGNENAAQINQHGRQAAQESQLIIKSHLTDKANEWKVESKRSLVDTGTSTDSDESKSIPQPALAYSIHTSSAGQIFLPTNLLPQPYDEKIPVSAEENHPFVPYPQKEPDLDKGLKYLKPGDPDERHSFELPLQGIGDEDFILPIQSPDDPDPVSLKLKMALFRRSAQSPIPVDSEIVPIPLSNLNQDGADAPEPVALHLPAEMEAEVPPLNDAMINPYSPKKKASRRSRILAPFTGGTILGSRRERNRSISFRMEDKSGSSAGSPPSGKKSMLPAIDDQLVEHLHPIQPSFLRKPQTGPEIMNEMMELRRHPNNSPKPIGADQLARPESASSNSRYETITNEYGSIQSIHHSKLGVGKDNFLTFFTSDCRYVIYMRPDLFQVYDVPVPFDNYRSSPQKPRYAYHLGDEEGFMRGKCPWKYIGGAASTRYIATIMKDKVQVHDFQKSCKVIQTISLNGYELSSVAISADKMVIGLASVNEANLGIIWVYKKSHLEPKWEKWSDIHLPPIAPSNPQKPPHFLCLTKDGKFLTACNWVHIFAWDLPDQGEPLLINNGGAMNANKGFFHECSTCVIPFPDTKHILYSTFSNSPIESGCFIESTRSTDNPPLHNPIRQVGSQIYQSAVSPNGHAVALLSKTGHIYVIPVARKEGGGQVRTLAAVSPPERLRPSSATDSAGGIIFGPQGDQLVAVDWKGNLMIICFA